MPEEKTASRFDIIEENAYGNTYEQNDVASDLRGYISAGGGRDYDDVEKVKEHTYCPGGISGHARPVYEVRLKEGVSAVVPFSIQKVASYRNLEVTATEIRNGQRVLLLEPADTDQYPR